jgi:hypothetical protein
MSDYADTAPTLSAYLRLMERVTPSARRLRRLVRIEEYLRDEADGNPYLSATAREQLLRDADAVLARPEWASMVCEKLESDDPSEVGSVIYPAERLGIETRAVLWSWLAREPLERFWWSRLTAGASREEMKRLVEAADRLLPLDGLATGPSYETGWGARLGLGPQYEADWCLAGLLLGLHEFPGEGWRVISVGLRNRVVRNRTLALRALSAWPREQWPAEAEPLLEEAFWREPDKNLRTRMRALIDGGSLPD